MASLTGYPDEIQDFSFSPDGRTIATASGDGTVKLWTLGGEKLQTFTAHKNWVKRVSFSPDSQSLVTASSGGEAKLWNLTGKELATLETINDGSTTFWDISFSPDGKTIAIARDSSVILENFDLEQLSAIACHWLKDYLERNPQGEQSLYRDCKAMKVF